ncbi:hydroxypyruvate isomerase family protein [Vibrio vulnificus]|uniref:2-oxo-tetronate isomerase n=1 Tax=Vibrio vulnificus TaxID=672 RepID=UPI0002E7EBD7|nr:2-oxo-tetronate isomerase [Vibrio vulnificus]EGR0234029.1 hydroxypyruvate isomerase family protein [Vibrio vulnificus]EGR7967780.1 hydroxypyruvate isomerase family protein [Vibrio vulnificus]EHI9272452.1 hydroxypyruvate isomerase family protein [Vibrio vulnificus]EHK8974611.1 hydroxypyruvate isomerase family protein [Vibrio vulnificus]EHU4916813.1 hydroxypyruvate isomerase family protein [Vibrio vulnificus]
MAKFAANLTMLFNEVDFLERFEQAHQCGFKAVEYLFPYAYEPKILADKLTQYGFEQALFNMPPGDWDAGERGFAAIPGREEEFKQSVETSLLYAQALNCKKVHAMSGIVDAKFTRQQHIETFINNIRYAADKFAKYDIELLIEPLNNRDVPDYFIAHQREAVELIKQVKRSNVRLQFDLYHAQIMDGDLTVMIRDLADYIGHVQIASVPLRHEPSEGEINYPYIFEQLDLAGYQGWMGCEYKPKQSTKEGLVWAKNYL